MGLVNLVNKSVYDLGDFVVEIYEAGSGWGYFIIEKETNEVLRYKMLSPNRYDVELEVMQRLLYLVK